MKYFLMSGLILFALVSTVSAAEGYTNPYYNPNYTIQYNLDCSWTVWCNVEGASVYLNESLYRNGTSKIEDFIGTIKDHKIEIPYTGVPETPLRISAKGYDDKIISLEQPWKGQNLEYYVDLDGGKSTGLGSIIFTSEPAAEIYVQTGDDYLRNNLDAYRKIGETPYRWNYQPSGWFRVRFESQGYIPKTVRARIVADDLLMVDSGGMQYDNLTDEEYEEYLHHNYVVIPTPTPTPTPEPVVVVETAVPTPQQTRISIAPDQHAGEPAQNHGSAMSILMMMCGVVLMLLMCAGVFIICSDSR